MQKAEEISKQLGHNEFTASEGWFYRWKKRHDLSYIKLHGEASEANTKAAAEWTCCNMQELLKKYEPANIYNADETAQIVSKNSDGDDMDDQEEDAENDETPEEATPSSAEIRFYMHRLQIGLQRRGFDKMNEFEKLNGHVQQFLRHQQPMRQLTLDVFARK